jgi:hypothetical protein
MNYQTLVPSSKKWLKLGVKENGIIVHSWKIQTTECTQDNTWSIIFQAALNWDNEGSS